ncbi:AAA family ATPase [Blastococcus brunescens]|uniref:AAA family ATPase n=1 Tax=Blastococcus brunescens TaxID=1564165 RepID=A0ABZ1B4C1_9ACTN|nr:AAA family ATPase [Blastococcus sp. BMG 8361]WRL65649.1 AAA family ATPase [Blastococcus sp. BMG 8361]
MSIFDSPSVNFHVDDDLEYVYVPAVLALFNHVISGIKAVQSRIESGVSDLKAESTTLLSRFPKESSVYPLIETLGASTDLEDLKGRVDNDPKVDGRIDALRRAVAALEANTVAAQITFHQRAERVLSQATTAATVLNGFDVTAYNTSLAKRVELQADYKAFRAELFAAADLPADPEESWEAFVAGGEVYRQHLAALGVHDIDRCLYCRQPLSDPAKDLVKKYGDYLSDKISADITATTAQLTTLTAAVRSIQISEMTSLLREYEGRDDQPSFYEHLQRLEALVLAVRAAVADDRAATSDAQAQATTLLTHVEAAHVHASDELHELGEQARNRASALSDKKKEVSELVAAAELAKSWSTIQNQVRNAKEADRLKILARALPNHCRAVTDLSKDASDQLINKSFDKLFVEECRALRAPSLKVEFVGRQGKAQRRKVLSGKYKPSRVLSEGEQKVLAMADFLAEARLAGITAPVIFDDPVSNLDHRRINEVAQRVAVLTENNQVIVFTHDIFFATTLLGLFEQSKRCSYFHITDEEGKGTVTRATGPRWDSLSNLKKNVNQTIQAAKVVDGEARAALVREGYDWIRAWCEVFAETELLKGVSQRYQPNIRMTVLPNIKTEALPEAIAVVTRVFEDACRYIAGHSQPLPTLGVSPTLSGLETHWGELQECRRLTIRRKAARRRPTARDTPHGERPPTPWREQRGATTLASSAGYLGDDVTVPTVGLASGELACEKGATAQCAELNARCRRAIQLESSLHALRGRPQAARRTPLSTTAGGHSLPGH